MVKGPVWSVRHNLYTIKGAHNMARDPDVSTPPRDAFFRELYLHATPTP
jgi:hypothetical protein